MVVVYRYCCGALSAVVVSQAKAKGSFFKGMRERMQARGHKVADYDICF